MGNRAVITTKENWKHNGVGIYLLWNGGRDSVEAFLKYCDLKGYRSPSVDCYGWARLAQVIGNFFGGGLSIGIDTIWHLDRDNKDNGVYIIDDWNIVDRYFYDGHEQDKYSLNDMLISIDKCMPEDEQLGEEFLLADTYAPEELEIGDTVFEAKYGEHHPSKYKIIALMEDDITGKKLPIMDAYGDSIEAQLANRYNVLRGKRYKAIKGGKKDER